MNKKVMIGIIVGAIMLSLLVGFVVGLSVGSNQPDNSTTATTTTKQTTTTTKRTTTTTKRTTTTTKKTTVKLPDVPIEINAYHYVTGALKTTVKITNINYEVYSDRIELKYSGEKLYDIDGDNSNYSCHIKFKVYDSGGYVIKSGELKTTGLKVGEKFRDEKATIRFDVVAGETYTIELLDKDY